MVLVDKEKPDIPVAMIERFRDFEEDRRFMSFESMAPPASSFTVPSECMKLRHH